MVVMPKFELSDFCRLVQEYKITMGYIVPPIILQLAKNPVVDKYDLSSLRMVNSGAAPLTKELVQEFYARLKVPVKQGYGLSETSPTTHNQPWDRWRSTIGSVGTLLANQTAKYMNEKDEEVPVGQVGELWIKGPNVFQGYLNNAEGTKNALTEDGYFKTGDVGYQDKEGNFYITDRVKELIKYSGFQVPPADSRVCYFRIRRLPMWLSRACIVRSDRPNYHERMLCSKRERPRVKLLQKRFRRGCRNEWRVIRG